MVANTPIQLGAWHDDSLVGYARAITDGCFRALIDDVVVDKERHGQGIGEELMRRLTKRLSGVEQVILLCDDRFVGFYERLGFVRGGANCMVLAN